MESRGGRIAAATNRVAPVVVLGLLAFDGVLSAIGGALFLPSYIGAIPFPLSALASGAVNAALVFVAMRWTSRNVLAALPVWTWLLTVLVMARPGPGGDVIFAGRGITEFSPFLLLAAGTLLPFWVLLRRRTAP
ncbi:hypothetical protein MKK62_06100 [Mycobacterium paraterrae]|uniref:Facilitated glucose transporter n=1 Tax=Mycobacterium paraterrae TaxID=577492 RepID=A0ABY3VZC7_9MYCO|nr:hypothetical protein [Mycobacterium paraterrae]UMB72143.1 hypothetical protein MKK62_06100 [Mycobacterium paraterrae]